MEKFPILISYAYLRKATPDAVAWWTSQPDIEVLLDSGAFTAWSTGDPIQVEDYIAFLKDWGHGFWNYFALDVVKEPGLSRKNLYKMWDAGLTPLPVHVFGEDEAWMNELYKHTDYIALVIRQQMGDPERFINRVLQLKMDWAARRKVHWLGYTRQKQIAKHAPFSCDCTSWSSAALYGLLAVYLGRGKWRRFSFKDINNHVVERNVLHAIEAYGFSADDLRNPDLWRANTAKGIPRERHMSYQVTIASWIAYIQDIKTHFGTKLFPAVRPCITDSRQFIQRIRGIGYLDAAPWRKKKGVSDESSSTGIRRVGQHGASSSSREGEARGGIRIVSRLRPAARAGTQFRQEGLLDVGDSD